MAAAAAILVVACGNSPKKRDQAPVQTPTRGQATVLVDETFYPLIKGELAVFSHTYKYADIELVCSPEQMIVKELMADAERVAILSRELTDAEKAHFEALKLVPKVTPIAYDAIALITSRESSDTLITVDALRKMLRGGAGSRTLVFDHPASGTVRYMREFAGADSLPGAYSARTAREVLEYVASNPGAIGFTGVDWLYEADSADRQYIDRIRVMTVSDAVTGVSKPTQNDVAEGKYPFIRKIYFINCQGTAGLGLGFSSFLAGDIGQRIVLKSGLVPVTYPKREIVVRKQL